MKPVIGITGTLNFSEVEGLPRVKHTLRTEYTKAVLATGGAPVVLPLATKDSVRDIVSHLDGVILSGGADIPAEAFGANPHPSCRYLPAERWNSERLWLRAAQELGVPVLGICLGMQVINVAGGGSLIQDLPTQFPTAHPHAGPGIGFQHEVAIEPNSWLASAAGSPSVTVTSAHHQSIDRLAEGYRVTATARDGVIEAIEHTGSPFVVGVQWHPERCLDQPNWIFRAFVKAAGGI